MTEAANDPLAPARALHQFPVTGFSPTYTLHLPKRTGKPLGKVERNRLKDERVG